MEFKDRIKELRTNEKISAIELAKKLNKSESAIRMWETGKAKPDCDTLIKLSEYFDVSTNYLLGLSEHKNEKEIKMIEMGTENINSFIRSLDGYYKESFSELIKYIVPAFLLTQEDNSDSSKKHLAHYAEFVSCLSSFYCTRYGIFPPKHYKKEDKNSNGRLLTGFELIDAINCIVRDFLNISQEKAINDEFTEAYKRYQLFWENYIEKKEANSKSTPANK